MKQDLILNVIAIIVCLLFIIIHSKSKREFLRGVQIQNWFWLVGFIIYLFGIVDYYPLNEKVYACALLYLVTFNVAYSVRPLSVKRKNKKINTNQKLENIKNEDDSKMVKKCIVASIMCWIASIGILSKSIPILMLYGSQSGLNELRYRTYGEYTIFSTPEMMLMNYIIRPIFTVTIILMAKEIATRKINYALLVFGLLDAFWLILATAGRALLVSMITYIVFATIILNGTNILSILKKYNKYIIPGLILLVIILQISSKRINRDNGIIEETIIYYFSGLPYFSTMINQNIAKPFCLSGKGMVSFIIDFPFLMLKYFGVPVSGGSQYLSNIANGILPVGENLNTNATASALLTFYSDFGILGSVVGGVLLGRIARQIEKKLSDQYTIMNFAKYLYIIAGLSITVQNYPFVGITATMTWLFINILLK